MVIKIDKDEQGFSYGLKIVHEDGHIHYDWSADYWECCKCELCDEPILDEYVHIIEALIVADLLPDDYKYVCCGCLI